MEEYPLKESGAELISNSRSAAVECLHGKDDQLVVVVGPCSIHDSDAALEYAQHLKALSDQLADDLLIIVRVYFEKPRTIVGWKGLINDPYLDGSYAINDGLRKARNYCAISPNWACPAPQNYSTPSPRSSSAISSAGSPSRTHHRKPSPSRIGLRAVRTRGL